MIGKLIEMNPEAHIAYLENLLSIVHAACVEPCAHVGLHDEVWQSLSDITGIPHPFSYPVMPYEPDEKDFKDRGPEYY